MVALALHADLAIQRPTSWTGSHASGTVLRGCHSHIDTFVMLDPRSKLEERQKRAGGLAPVTHTAQEVRYEYVLCVA